MTSKQRLHLVTSHIRVLQDSTILYQHFQKIVQRWNFAPQGNGTNFHAYQPPAETQPPMVLHTLAPILCNFATARVVLFDL